MCSYVDIFFGIPDDCVIKVREKCDFKMCLKNANVVVKSSNTTAGNGDQQLNGANEEAFPLAPDDSGDEEEVAPVIPLQSDNHHLLKNTLYSYKRVNLSHRLRDEDLKRVPKHTQPLSGQMSKDSILPKGEEHLRARVIQAFFEFTETEREKRRQRKYDIPMFQRRYYRFSRYKSKTVKDIKFFSMC